MAADGAKLSGGETALLDFLKGLGAMSSGGEIPLLDFFDGFAELTLDCFEDLVGFVGFVLPEGAATELGAAAVVGGFGVYARSPG